MKTATQFSTAAQKYAQAHAAHYAERDLLGALRSYCQVIASHAGAPEAGYSRAQILGIVNQVVPAAELLAAQTELALQHLRLDSDGTATASPA